MRVFTSKKEAMQWAAVRPEATIKVVKDNTKEQLLEELRNTPDAVF